MTTTKDNSKPDAVPEKKPKPVPPIVTGVPKPKEPPKMELPKPPTVEPPKSKDPIQTDDSDQPTTLTNPTPVAGQIGAEDANNNVATPASTASPPVKDTPPLPFNEKDLMTGKSQRKPEPQVPAVLPDKTVPAIVSDKDLDRQMSDKKAEAWLTKRGDSYKVHGTVRPDSASIQRVSNDKGVCTEILSAVQTDKYAESRVRAHLDGVYVDAVVHHCFENYRRLLILEMVNKNSEILDCWDGEMPVIKKGATIKDASGKTKDAQYTIMHTYFSFIQFALRDATTKAEAAAQAKILNQEFREKEDIESEQFEVDLIKHNK